MPPQQSESLQRHQHRHFITKRKQYREDEECNVTMTMKKSDLVFKKGNGGEDSVHYTNWGFPGYLTEEEYVVYEKFRTEVLGRQKDVQDTVFSFRDAHENDAYALCRWLRARKFDLEKTIQMIEEATECASEPRRNNFFPSQTLALGCDPTYYMKQYPQVYYGHARNGCPIFYSKPSQIDMNCVETLTSFADIVNYHWNGQMHGFVSKLRDQYTSSNGAFKRYGCVCILDLKDVTASQMSKRPLKLIKEQSAIDSLCFPETLSHMAIVNAPGFFALTWRVIKSWIDPRTTSKVSVLGTNMDVMVEHLSKYIDVDSLPSDYGGRGKSLDEVLHEDMITRSNLEDVNLKNNDEFDLKVERKDTILIPLRGDATQEINVKKDRLMKVTIFVRSPEGAILTIRDGSGSILPALPNGGVHVKHLGSIVPDENELPTNYDLEEKYGITFEEGNFRFELTSFGSRYKTVNILIGISEYSKHVPQVKCVQQEKIAVSQVGGENDLFLEEDDDDSECEPVLLSSKSICTGKFGEDAFGGITLMRSYPIIRKERVHEGDFVKAYDESPHSANDCNMNNYSCFLNHITAGCGEFPKSLSMYLE